MSEISPQLQFWAPSAKGYWRPQRFLEMTFKQGNIATPREYLLWLYNAKNSFSERIATTGKITLSVPDATWAAKLLVRSMGEHDPLARGITPMLEAVPALADGHRLDPIPASCGRRLFFSLDQSIAVNFSVVRVEVRFKWA